MRALFAGWTAPGHPARRVLVLAVAAAVAIGALWLMANTAAARPDRPVPRDPTMEGQTGVRFTSAAVVADGGIIELRYVVLDANKASRFQNNVKRPPRLYGEQRTRGTAWRTALMKQGHTLRPGQTYYILYLNNGFSIRRGDTLEISTGTAHLAHVPVQ